MNFSRYVLAEPYFDWLCHGLAMTLWITALSSALTGILALAALRCHLASSAALRGGAAAFVAVFRNLPLVPLLLFAAYGLPAIWRQTFGVTFPRNFEFTMLVVTLALNTAAYVTEILRAGINAVAPQQAEVARTLGLSSGRIRLRVIYPQAFRIVAPALASRFIHNMKNSSLCLVVPLPMDRMELMGQAGRIAGETFSWVEPLAVAAGFYLLLALAAGQVLNAWARRQQARVVSAL